LISEVDTKYEVSKKVDDKLKLSEKLETVKDKVSGAVDKVKDSI